MAWATEAEVLALTGRTVTADQVAQAQAIIELFAETTPEADADQSAKTLRLLNRAVSWQAAWMATQIDIDARVDVQTLSQDGVSTQFSGDDAQYLAPLAARCLNKLPWRRSRSVFTGNRPGDRYDGIQAARDNVVYERDDERDGQEWIPLYS
ncbi:MAG TPA: hypothetical protein VM430_18865 [Microbacterium sp.]|nr:hypothetical protein [Microbacterium sp.]